MTALRVCGPVLVVLCAATVTLAAASCPSECVCKGASVDCSYKGLTMIPTGILPTTERL